MEGLNPIRELDKFESEAPIGLTLEEVNRFASYYDGIDQKALGENLGQLTTIKVGTKDVYVRGALATALQLSVGILSRKKEG